MGATYDHSDGDGDDKKEHARGEPELANGDTVEERVANIDLSEDKRHTADEIRERLGL